MPICGLFCADMASGLGFNMEFVLTSITDDVKQMATVLLVWMFQNVSIM